MQAYNLSPLTVMEVIRDNNQDGWSSSSHAETELAVRGKGYLRSLDDLRNLVIREVNGAPVRIQDVARVVRPPMRRGLTEPGQGR